MCWWCRHVHLLCKSGQWFAWRHPQSSTNFIHIFLYMHLWRVLVLPRRGPAWNLFTELIVLPIQLVWKENFILIYDTSCRNCIWYMYHTKICTATADDWYRFHSLTVKQHGNKQVRWLGVLHNPLQSDHCYLKQWIWCLYSVISGTSNQFTKRCYTKYRYSSNLEVLTSDFSID